MRGKAPQRIEDCPVCGQDAEYKEVGDGQHRPPYRFECPACDHYFYMYSNENTKRGDDNELDVYEYMELNNK